MGRGGDTRRASDAIHGEQRVISMEQVDVLVEVQERLGALEWWRHALSHGGINTRPLPGRVVRGLARLRPRLIRIFVQEHFTVYPERGRFDWSVLDAFMDSLAQTGAKVVAAITIKPKVLYPKVDHAVWRPTDWGEWQRVVREMVKRYSLERQVVSHWEIGNETDIGESGGSPYLIPDAKDYFEYYRNTIGAVREAWPEAKVGGPAACWVDNEPLPGLVKLCRETKTPLDFVSWHLYSDDASRHALGVEKERVSRPKGRLLMKGLMSTFSMKRPSSARILTASSRATTRSRPSPGTWS